jgi:hypothetical protein
VTPRRVAVTVVAGLALVALLVAVGRWERQRRADEEMAGMRRVVAAVGSLGGPDLVGFRYFQHFQCLGYRRPEHPIALELCVDPEGRVVEAIDRRGGEPAIWSLRDDPTVSRVRVDRREVDRLLVRMGVPPRLIREAHRQGST